MISACHGENKSSLLVETLPLKTITIADFFHHYIRIVLPGAVMPWCAPAHDALSNYDMIRYDIGWKHSITVSACVDSQSSSKKCNPCIVQLY